MSMSGNILIKPDDEKTTCWICFATEEDDRRALWVKPCSCRGTTKYVHQMCLQRWVDEKQNGNSTAKVNCPQCGKQYQIIYPQFGRIIFFLDLLDRMIYKTCPFVAGGIIMGSIYWTAVTYGAVTVMQVLGHKEGLNVMESADPLFLLIGLPTIPIVLILSKMVHWENYVLRIWRKYSSKLPTISHMFGAEVETTQQWREPTELDQGTNMNSLTRMLCGSLILPTIATIAGKLMFGRVQSNFQRTLLGGIAVVAIKGVMNIYFKHHQYLRQAMRTIDNYDEEKALEMEKQQAETDARQLQQQQGQ